MESKNNQQITFNESAVVIGSIIVVTVIIFAVVDFPKHFFQAQNAQRTVAVNSVLNAYSSFVFNNDGAHPVITDTQGDPIALDVPYEIGTGVDAATCAATSTSDMRHVDLRPAFVGKYIAALPIDPVGGSAMSTGYYYVRGANNQVRIGSCEAAHGELIEAQR